MTMAENTNTELAVKEDVKQDGAEMVRFDSAFATPQGFEHVQRVAKMLAVSDMIPDNYKQKIGNCVIALEIANRIGANIIAVMQNLYIVHGKPGWSSQFLISCVNASGRFTPLRYQMSGEGDDWGCVAWAHDKSRERLESPRVTIGMAKAEGWFAKNGSKWKTMPELMLRYRAATFFTRLYAPELTMGMQTVEEIIDIPAEVIGSSDGVKQLAAPVKSTKEKMNKLKQKIDAFVSAPNAPATVDAEVTGEEDAEESTERMLVRVITETGAPVTLDNVVAFLREKKGMSVTTAINDLVTKKPVLDEVIRKNPAQIVKDTAEFMGK